MSRYQFRTKDLCRELGISRQSLFTWERKGYLTSPRVGTRGDRRFTRTQLDQIVKAFSPGGKKQWHFRGEETV